MIRIISFLLLALIPSTVRAQDLNNFYNDKRVRVIVGVAPGTDQDNWGRLVQRHIGKHIPGTPSVQVENMPGAGGLRATNYLFTVAPADGTVIGLISRSMPMAALMKFNGVQFDPLKFNWLGSPEKNHYVLFVNTSTQVKSASDLYAREIIVGGTGDAQGISAAANLLRNLMGMKIRLVTGYTSITDLALAAKRNEVDAFVSTVGGLDGARRPWVQSGDMRMLFNFEPSRVKGLDMPTIYEQANSDVQRDVLRFFSGSVLLGRPFVTPPNVPADRVAVLRKALESALSDPALLSEAEAMKIEITPQTGDELTKLVAELMAASPSIIQATEAATKMK